MRLTALLLLLIAACGTNHLPEAVQPFSVDKNARRIQGVTEVSNELAWRRSPYWRLDDFLVALPVFLAIADDNSACIIPGDVWVIAKRGDFVICAGRWRMRRP